MTVARAASAGGTATLYSTDPSVYARMPFGSEIPTTIHDNSYSHQTMVGISRQLGTEWAVEVSYQYTGQRQEEVTNNQNLTYDAATGDNIPFSVIASRVYPEWGYINGEYMQGWSNAACRPITFALEPDVEGEYTYAATDQRHRAVMNGIWDVGRGLQLSGLYFYGSGMRTAVTCGSCQVRDT